MHEIPVITTIALGLSAALLFGLVVKRLGLSPIVGYLIAGIVIGPYTPGVFGSVDGRFATVRLKDRAVCVRCKTVLLQALSVTSTLSNQLRVLTANSRVQEHLRLHQI